MNKIFGFLLIILLLGVRISAQETLVIKADDSNSRNAVLFYLSDQNTQKWGKTNDNHIKSTENLFVIQWTWYGNPGTESSLIDFDLSDLPHDAEIISAKLSLTIVNGLITNYDASKSKEFIIRRIVEDWDENTVTWNNQPKVTDVNKIVVADNQDFKDIDITPLLKDMIKYPDKSFGMMLSNSKDDYYRGFSVAGNTNPNPDIRPKLTIVYKTNSGYSSAKNKNKKGNTQIEPNDKISTCGNNQTLVIYDSELNLVINEKNVSSDRTAEIFSKLQAGNYLVQFIDTNQNVVSFKISVN